jgi:2-polyprenyl-6-methoxyphenol hydroxylase-like FAD-dependent oxidoreductase
MTERAVVIAGGGPTGLMLAGELALAGVDVAIAERRASHDLAGSRAGGLHSRTIEIFDQRGIADRFLSAGQVAQVAGFAMTRLDISDFPTRHPYGLGLWQNHIERILAGWVRELKVPIYYGREVTGFAQDDTGVDVALSDGDSLRAQYLVGCDGGRSVVRQAAGIEFAGWDPTVSCLIAEVELATVPELGIRHDALGTHSFGRLEYEIRDGKVVYKDVGPIRVMVTEQHVGGHSSEPTLGDLSEALITVYGTDYGAHSPTWISRFTDMTRQAAAYRERRVLLAGDAAHVHSPVGGQGLNTGVQDAVNLGWKLAQVVKRTSPESLLDTYHAERHPIAARVLRNTMAQVALLRPDERTKAVRETIGELLGMDEPRKRFAAMMTGLDIHYDLGPGHPLLGRRMPDLDLVTANGAQRVFALLRDARPVLINFGERGSVDITPWADRVQLVDATHDGAWELPVIGAVTAPSAVLIRPDGYVAWVGERTETGLVDALAGWFGPPRAPGWAGDKPREANRPAGFVLLQTLRTTPLLRGNHPVENSLRHPARIGIRVVRENDHCRVLFGKAHERGAFAVRGRVGGNALLPLIRVDGPASGVVGGTPTCRDVECEPEAVEFVDARQHVLAVG